MYKLNLKLNNLSDFCHVLNKFKADFNINNGYYVVDGKSLLGLHTLNFNKDIYLQIIDKDDELLLIIEELKKFLKK